MVVPNQNNADKPACFFITVTVGATEKREGAGLSSLTPILCPRSVMRDESATETRAAGSAAL